MSKKNLFFAAVAIALCAICSSCNNKSNCYLKWEPAVLFGDAKAQTNYIDSVCKAEAAIKNYAVAGERLVNLNTTDKNAAIEMMKEFCVAVEKGMTRDSCFTVPDIDGNGDYENQTCYITYQVCRGEDKGTGEIKTTTTEVKKAGFIYKK